MSRRRTGIAAALFAACSFGTLSVDAVPPDYAVPPAYVSFDGASLTWRIGNTFLERALSLDGDGHFLTASFVDKRTGRDWARPGVNSGEFRISFVPAGADVQGVVSRTGRAAWRLVSESRRIYANGTAELGVTLLEPDDGIEVTAHYQCFPETPVIRSWLDVSNTGSAPVTLTAADAYDLRVQGDGSAPDLLWVHNFTWAHPDLGFYPETDSPAPGEKVAFTTGPFGDGAAWFALRGARPGSGLFGGWEWSGTGDFQFTYSRWTAGLVALRAGFAEGHFAHVLAPGESFTAPAGFVGFFTGGWDGAAIATRRLVESRYAPPLPDANFPYAGFDTWGYSENIDENLVGNLIDRAADLGAETFTLDAGWMDRIGNWRPRPGAFDGGIAALSDHAHQRGLKFGLWMAFGVADPSSDVVQQHPEWVATDEGEPIAGDFGSVALCLGNPDVQAWVISEIDRVVNDYGVDWLLHDFGVIAACTNPAHGHQAGDGEWATTAGYYAILDEVRRRHPKLIIENCWDGGSMIDFGMVRRHDTSNTSDYNSALTGRQGVYGLTYVLPPRFAGKYIGDDGTPPAYRFASGIPGGPLLLMGQPTAWDAATASAARSAVGLFKRLRPLLRDGTLYHLSGPPSPNGWDGLLSWDRVLGRGILLAYRGENPATGMTLFPRGLPDAGTFQLLCEHRLVDGTLAGGILTAAGLGQELEREGIAVSIPDPDGTAVIRLLDEAAAPAVRPRER